MNIDRMMNIYSVFTGCKMGKSIDNEQKSKIVEILAQEISAVCKTKTRNYKSIKWKWYRLFDKSYWKI